MFPAPSLRFELLVRMSRSVIAMVDGAGSLMAGRGAYQQTGSALVIHSESHSLEAWLLSAHTPANAQAAAGLLILPGIGDRMGILAGSTGDVGALRGDFAGLSLLRL